MKKKKKRKGKGRPPVVDESSVPGDKAENDESVGEAIVLPEVVPEGKSGPPAPVTTLQRYLADIRRYPPLTPEEEFELAVRYREEGDPEAAYKLVTSNLMLVVKVASDFRRAYQNLLDLIQEGNIGLMLAVRKFDPFKNVRLPSYATWWIRAYILKFILDNWRLVRVGTTNVRRKLLYNLQKEKERLEAEGFEVGPKLLAERFGVAEEDIVDVEKSLGKSDFSLDEPVFEDSGETRADSLRTGGPLQDEVVAGDELRQIFKKYIGKFRKGLDRKELVILDERLLSEEPKTLQEIGEKFGITREGVRQIEKKLKKKLELFLKEHLPEDFKLGS
jgi:RNA polymerase sigma-32 factor